MKLAVDMAVSGIQATYRYCWLGKIKVNSPLSFANKPFGE